MVRHMKRQISWFFGVLAYVAPPVWAYFEQLSVYGGAEDQNGYVCGLPMLAIIVLACIGAAVLSGLATLFGTLSFLSLSKPRPRLRIVELVVLGLPFVFSAAYVGIIFSV